MKRITTIILLIFSFNLYSNAQETVWDVKNTDFWDEIKEDNTLFEKEKTTKLEAQIELELNAESYDIDLIDAINKALENSSSYKISKYQKEYSDWEFRNKLSEFLPNIGYSFSLSDLSGEFLVGGVLPRSVHETVYSSTFTAKWEIINGKRIFESIQLKNQQKSKKHNENYTKAELIYKVCDAYYDLLEKKFDTEIYRYNLIEVEEQLKYNQALYDIGKGTRFDILRSQTEVENAKAEIQTAIFNLKIAQTKLANLSGYPIFANINPKEKIIHKLDLIDENSTLEELYNQAITLREDIKAKERSIKASRAKRNINIAELIPSVSLNWERAYVGTFSAGGRNNDTYGLLVTVPFGKNLGVNNFTKYKMDNASYKIELVELEKLKSDIKEKITNNYYGSITDEKIINAKNNQIISTKEGLKHAIGRMKIGEATYLDVLEANKEKTQARIELIKAIVSYNKNQVSQLFETGNINLMEIKTKYELAKALFEK